MPRFLLVILFSFAMAANAKAQDRAIEQVIEGQIAAMRADDFVAAFEFASPNIQTIFKTPQNFEAMVKRGYAMVVDPAEVRFLEQRQIAGSTWQKVLMRDAKGGVHLLDYQMIRAGEGWQIGAVQVLQAPEVAA